MKKLQFSKCYTFYSYKGGSGRSTTLMNTVKPLIGKLKAEPARPILIVDADLESAGLTYFFGAAQKFSDDFSESIHTARLLLPEKRAEYFLPASHGIESVFEAESYDEFSLTKEQFKKFNDLKEAYEAVKERPLELDFSLFEGIRLRENLWDMLLTVADVAERALQAQKNELADESADYFSENYDIFALIAQLKKIDGFKSAAYSVGREDRAAMKKKAIVDFLPTDTFLDVSAFFGVPRGTVKFLGVDARSRGNVVVKSKRTDGEEVSVSIIRELLHECHTRNYAAVLFDSAAGTQNSAHALHDVSDVIVYCVRPTRQFLLGTHEQIRKYRPKLIAKLRKDKPAKPIILLPTAVPLNDSNMKDLCDDAFFRLNSLLNSSASDYADVFFCTPKTCLPEVGVFKWYELILATPNGRQTDLGRTERLFAEMKPQQPTVPALEKYYKKDTLPPDAKAAYDVYCNLAEHIVLNTDFGE